MLRVLIPAVVVAAALTVAACGDGSVGDLNGLPFVPNGSGGAGGGGGGQGGDGGGAGDGAAVGGPSASEVAYRALAADLVTACGGACHSDGKGNAPAYLAMPDSYKTIKGYKGIVVKDVATSSLLTKGRHEGPDLVDPLRGKVYAWLELESKALSAIALPATDVFTVTPGANSVDISKGGTGVAGAKLLFNAQISGSIVTLHNMQLVAPATSGLHIVFPVFDIVHEAGEPTKDTSFSNADQTIAPGQTATLNPGLLILTGWSAADKMKIEFTKLEPGTVMMDGGTTTASGCKAVASFVTNAVPAVQQNGCLNCHNTGGSGNASLDLSALAKTPADNAKACAQMLAKADPNNAARSDIILAPTGGVANHPFQNASANYAQMIEAWLVSEK